MTKFKWLLLISQVILVFLPATVAYRDWKVYDKRTKKYKWFTRNIIFLNIAAAVVIAVSIYQDLSKTPKEPKLALYLSDVPLEDKSYITIPITNQFKDLTFEVANLGDALAEKVSLYVGFPTQLTISNNNGWVAETPLWVEPGRTLVNRSKFVKLFCAPINVGKDLFPNEIETIPTITVAKTNLYSSVNYCIADLVAKNYNRTRIMFLIHFTNSLGQPYLGN